MSKQQANHENEIVGKVTSLMGNDSPSDLLNPAVERAARLMLEAQSHLVAKGIAESVAMEKVKFNFDQCNLSGQVVTLAELTK